MKIKPDSHVPSAECIREAFAECGADDVAFLARQCLEAGAWDHALAICQALGSSDAPGVKLCEAVATFVSGESETALALVDSVLKGHPKHLSARAVKAQMLARSGNAVAARQQVLEVLARYPDYPGAHGLLATLLMPGPPYRDILSRLHDRLRPRCYLEIGVDTGATLALARHSQTVIGVDPADHVLQRGLPANARLFAEESETFFALRSREQVLGAQRVDLAFIDGLHLFENVLSDFVNVERWAHANATVVLHDCLPIVPQTTTRERSTEFWVGDAWKIVPVLTRFRPDLRIRTLLTPPSGLVVVRRLNPGSTLLEERSSEVLETMAGATWSCEPGVFPSEFQVIHSDEAGLSQALG